MGHFQKRLTDKSINPYFINDNDDDDDDENVFIDWDFKRLLKLINSNSLRDQTKIHNEAKTAGYEDMYDENGSNDISRFEECYLGFSFIVPESTDSKAQQKYYSKAFRSINIEGKKLLPLESREALYYLNKDLVGLFSPDFSEMISVNEGKLDFVRYLSMLSQYSNEGKDKIARGYSKNMETYYENFIYSVVDDKKTKEFVKLSDIIPNLNYKSRMEKLRVVIDKMNLKTKYESIIDLDLYLFGIIYLIIFEGKQIDSNRYEELKLNIKKEIDNIRKGPLHIKNPSALKHLKQRIDRSINICEEYIL